MDDSVSDETQFIHGRKLHLLRPKDVAGISSTYYNCRNAKPGEAYEDISSFCKSANIDEIATHDFVLTPGRYAGAADITSRPSGVTGESSTCKFAGHFVAGVVIGAVACQGC